jgi:hypothetical protein
VFDDLRTQDWAEQFSNWIDVLALQLSSHLGGWSRHPLLFAITPAKALLVLVILSLGFALGALARALMLQKVATIRAPAGSADRFWRAGRRCCYDPVEF